ncbi:DNA-processing protein DprA [Jonesiaceae bacterium BS-20]|uniref:DNA-processing protein DprA n=1 Tax=Jonesiaceae bacterium BS-20 TaxID=3120821 RepID=A0AAU7DZJ6_9MICO
MITQRTSAMMWARLAEPGDRAAGTVVSHLGLTRSIDWLTAHYAGSQDATLARLLDDMGIEHPSQRKQLGEHLARWQLRWADLDVDQEEKAAQLLGAIVITRGHDLWPTALDDLMEESPFCLWALGNPDLRDFAEEGVSIVGARAASAYGEHVTANLVSELVGQGHPILSGGAYGIDAVAHRAALASHGITAAVMAGGIDQLYPAGNTNLLRNVIAQDGTVLTELPPGSVPSRVRFLRRNRLIAALTKVTVVVEAAWRSGTLSTANHAFEIGRAVGAVPGPVTSVQSAGCHRLLKESAAQCVTDAQDIIELAGFNVRSQGTGPELARQGELEFGDRLTDSLNPIEKLVFDVLSPRTLRTLDEVATRSGVTMGEAMAAVAQLEGRKVIERVGYKWRRFNYRN